MNDEIDIPLDEIDQFIEENHEIDIDIEQFIAYQRLKYEKESEMEVFESMASDMRECIAQGRLSNAAEIAEELKGCNYLGFKSDIDECFRICADAGIVSAMKHMIWKHQNNGNQFPIPDSFAYLKKLSDLGYVKSFNPLGQCYYHGIGCEVSYEHAAEEFMKGYIFTRDAYCVETLVRIMNFRRLDGTRIRSLYEKLFDDGRVKFSINQITVMIYNREIKDYPPDAAYYLLFNLYRKFDYEDYFYNGEEDEDFCYGDIPYCLAKCLIDGQGIDPCPVLAAHVLESAEDDYDWWIRCGYNEDATKSMR